MNHTYKPQTCYTYTHYSHGNSTDSSSGTRWHPWRTPWHHMASLAQGYWLVRCSTSKMGWWRVQHGPCRDVANVCESCVVEVFSSCFILFLLTMFDVHVLSMLVLSWVGCFTLAWNEVAGLDIIIAVADSLRRTREYAGCQSQSCRACWTAASVLRSVWKDALNFRQFVSVHWNGKSVVLLS